MTGLDADAGIVTFAVKDLPRARAFYVDRLGLEVEREKSGGYVMVRLGPLILCINREDASDAARGGGAQVLLRVPDLKNTARALRERGIEPAYHRNKTTANIWKSAIRKGTNSFSQRSCSQCHPG